jgi:3-oxoacyl-[acyl-carrier-protein] synthase-3
MPLNFSPEARCGGRLRLQILDIASYLPETVLDNRRLSELTGREEDFFLRRTGIRQRRRAAPGENTNTMAVSAVRALGAASRARLADVDLVIGCSYTSWDLIGTLAHAVQREFVMTRARAFTLSSACSSAANALEVAAAFFDAGRSTLALIVAADHNSLHSNDSDQRSGHLWGDGAAAMLVSREPEPQACFTVKDVWTMGLGHVGLGPEAIALQPHGPGLVMPHGKDVFVQACEGMEAAARLVLGRNGLVAADLGLLVPHQANQRIIDHVAERLALAPGRVASTIASYGNTGCASAIVTLDEHQHRLAGGDLALVLTFGGGYSAGAALLQKLAAPAL